jgi:hypothetical protein
MLSELSTLIADQHILLDAFACMALRRLGGLAFMIRMRVKSARALDPLFAAAPRDEACVVLLLGDATASPLVAYLERIKSTVVCVRADQCAALRAKAPSLSVQALPAALTLAQAAAGVPQSLWAFSSDLHAVAASVSVHVASVASAASFFGVGRCGRIAASYGARLHRAVPVPLASGAPKAAVVFVSRELDLVPQCGGAGDSLFDALRDVVPLQRVAIDEDDGAFADDVLCATSLPFRTALVAGTQQAALECVQRALLDVLPPEDMAAFTGALTLAKCKKAAQLLHASAHHTLRLELALLALALAPASKRVQRRRESALRVALALACTDNFAAGVGHLEAQASERGEWTDGELRALVRAFTSAVGQAPSVDALQRLFGADAERLHGELERAGAARATELRRLGGVLVNERGEYQPFLRALAKQMFVDRDAEDCVHVHADDDVLGADYGGLLWPCGERASKATSLGSLLGGGSGKARVSDFSTVFVVVCGGDGVASASEVREVREQVALSALAKSLSVTVISSVPSLLQ